MAEKAPLKHFNGVSQFIKIQVLSQYESTKVRNLISTVLTKQTLLKTRCPAMQRAANLFSLLISINLSCARPLCSTSFLPRTMCERSERNISQQQVT